MTNVDSQEEAYLINKDTQEKVSATLDMGDEYNEIKIELTEEVTAKGSYNFGCTGYERYNRLRIAGVTMFSIMLQNCDMTSLL